MPKNLLLIWASFGLWQAVFLGASFFIPPAPDPMATWLPPLCGLLGTSVAGVSVMLGMVKRGGVQPRPAVIVRGALSEAAALLGVVSWYLSGDHLVQLGVAVAALFAWGLAFPRAAPQQ